jgi:hypothetical protein
MLETSSSNQAISIIVVIMCEVAACTSQLATPLLRLLLLLLLFLFLFLFLIIVRIIVLLLCGSRYGRYYVLRSMSRLRYVLRYYACLVSCGDVINFNVFIIIIIQHI